MVRRGGRRRDVLGGDGVMADGLVGVDRMRAAVVVGPGRTEIRPVARPEPASGEVRIRLEGCGVCASNVEPWSGPDWMSFPTDPGGLGHEGWGIVEAVGDGVTEMRPGDRVATLSQKAYAEFDLARPEELVPLPPALDGRPFPGEPLGCALNIFRRAEIRAGQTVAIVGVGFLGAILTRLASEAGARVLAVSRRPFALDVARRMGATETLSFEGADAVVGRVSELTREALCERVIEATGKQAGLDLAAKLAGVRGRLVIAGYHQDGPRQVDMQLWNWRGLDVINAHERSPAIYAQGVCEAVDAVASGLIDLDALLTHAFPLDRLDEALAATRDRPDGFLKAYVTCG